MKRLVIVLVAVAASWTIVGIGQEQTKGLAHFSFTVQETSTKMSLACEQGCAWKTLGWSVQAQKEVFINENGVIDEGTNKETGSGFVIGIRSSDDKMELSCKRGCAWKTLGYSPKSALRKVDEYGVGAK